MLNLAYAYLKTRSARVINKKNKVKAELNTTSTYASRYDLENFTLSEAENQRIVGLVSRQTDHHTTLAGDQKTKRPKDTTYTCRRQYSIENQFTETTLILIF